ncbi:MAG: methyltransferase domain-containing protein [Candidatus Eremiobacteraeota bacterium]|nr:methyltransferase domain-containing protein [Candidatus Eremiobacteraeota bacterium]
MATSPGACPVCGSPNTVRVLTLRKVPVHQNLLMLSAARARAIERGTIALRLCDTCGFVFNEAFESARLTYGTNYDNTQDCSPTFAAHMSALAADIAAAAPARAHVVEIGCGKGAFVRSLLEALPGAHGEGFDPSYEGETVASEGRLRFERRFFDRDATLAGVDVVVCRHVIEHVPDPENMLRALRAALNASPHARLYFETPCIEWIFRNRVVWDIFYEHCSLFSATSLAFAFEQAGFDVTDVRHVFEGQYLWLEAKPSTRNARATPRTTSASLAFEFARDFETVVERWRAAARKAATRGKVALWGAGAKGVTLGNLIDAETRLLDCVIDLNPRKQGRFLPGTGHAIVDPLTAASRGVRSALLMNPNYRHENEALVADAKLAIELIA